MFKRLPFFVAVLLFINVGKAFSQVKECDCLTNLDTLINKAERNYAGFISKTDGSAALRYAALKKRLKQEAPGKNKPVACFGVLKEYVRFFYDSHFQLSWLDDQHQTDEYIDLPEQEIRKQLKAKAGQTMEGIWINQDSSLKLGIIPSKDKSFKAIVLGSTDPKIRKGLVYMIITPAKRGFAVRYHNTFSATSFPIRQRGNLLQGWSDDLFGRIYPVRMNAAELKEQQTWRNGNHGLDFYKLSERTALLKIPTFGNNDARIAELIQRNDSTIRSTENLIVDLTGNGGGSTGWISFLNYFMTKPIKQENGYVRVSAENVRAKLADIEPYVTNPIPPDYLKYFPDSILRSYKKAYAELPVTKAAFYPVPGVVFPLDSVTVNPKKIALVVDNLCGSSTEYFFFLARESGKAVSYGINTFGMMDYEGASSSAIPYAGFRVAIPIVKSGWADQRPIDRTGFTPDVRLDQVDPTMWIRYIQERLEKGGK